MPLDAQFGVRYLWLLDPIEKTLEVFVLIDSRWTMISVFKDEEEVNAPPLLEVTISLADLWVESG